jgi:signal transduction histidine kinase
MSKRFFNSLYWKISAAFLIILFILSCAYSYIALFTTEMYFQEANQKLDSDIAPHIASENKCFIDGKANDEVLKSVFHNVMIINPSLEVYLLNNDGKILTYYAPNKTILLKYVPLSPIKKFISDKGNKFILGADPKKEEDQEKVFSAAEVIENGKQMGYIYVILGGEEYENAANLILGSYILRLGVRSMGFTLIAAAMIGLIVLGFITRNIRKTVIVIREFKNGNLNARIKLKGKGELSEFADSFNEMADTIVVNIEEMKTMDNLRRELVANVSHDLRTPLATIQGYLETILIKADSLSEEDKIKYMQTIWGSTERLKKLVEELFELSKLEAKETKPKPEAFSIAELVQDVQQKNLLIAESKKIELLLKFPYDLPLVFADIGMIEKVLQNLIDNAIKFTPEGGKIIIQLTLQNDEILASVSDTGIGINSKELPNIFDRYNQGKRTQSKEKQGLGLGLAIVKKILEVHSLDIQVESIEGKGTSFFFKVPLYKNTAVKDKAIQYS